MSGTKTDVAGSLNDREIERGVMSKKILLAGLGVLVGCLLLFAVLFFRDDRVGVTKENFDRIELGKTDKASVGVIFGRSSNFDSGIFNIRSPVERHIWDGDDGIAELTFDEKDIAVSKVWHGKSAWERVREFFQIRN